MRLLRLLGELRRRRVYRVTAAYVVGCFAVLEAADLVLPALGAPPWIFRGLLVLALAGLPFVIGLTWIFDVTPEGLKREGTVDEASAAPPLRRTSALRFWGVTAVVGLVGLGAWFAGRRSVDTRVPERSSTVAVLPFSPAVPDSALQRLGREVVITLSSTLSATADIETAEPLAVLATVEPDEGPLPLDRAREVANVLGAGNLVHGGLLRVDDGLRLEVSLYDTETLERIGSEGVTAARMDALTDSATLAVLRLIWSDAASAPPNPGAISTGSTEALEAYLAGERAIADGRWRDAPAAFARAVAADSTFWFAYWRLQYALEYHGSPVDSVIRARAWEHRHDLPDRDRLLIEARRGRNLDRLELLQEATTRYPSYWPAWWSLSELLVHHGGYLGRGLPESREALERTLETNPRFVSAWSHLFWVATRQRDAEAMSRIVAELSSADYDEISLQEAGINSLALYRALLTLVESEGGVPPRVVETGVEEILGYQGSIAPERLSSSLLTWGQVDAQRELSLALATHPDTPAPVARAQQAILAHAHAIAGAWDTALDAADAYAASASRVEDLLLPYQIATVGAWLGELPLDRAEMQRARLERVVAGESELNAEIAWLDGLRAFTAEDRTGLRRAMRTLRETERVANRDLLRSLDGFRTALTIGTDSAARALAGLEWEIADAGRRSVVGWAHTFVSGVNRLAAARWLVSSGDTTGARGLLHWHEAVLPGPLYQLSLANQVLATPALRLRRELARAAGRQKEASKLDTLHHEQPENSSVVGRVDGEARNPPPGAVPRTRNSTLPGRIPAWITPSDISASRPYPGRPFSFRTVLMCQVVRFSDSSRHGFSRMSIPRACLTPGTSSSGIR